MFDNVDKIPFVSFATMMKVEERSKERGEFDPKPKALQCVNCKVLMGWEGYRQRPEEYDAECPACRVKAEDFWKGKEHRKVEEDASS